LEDRRNVGGNSCNSGDGTDQTGPILEVYDDDDDDDGGGGGGGYIPWIYNNTKELPSKLYWRYE